MGSSKDIGDAEVRACAKQAVAAEAIHLEQDRPDVGRVDRNERL
jgi:hypothetical protein